MSNWRQRALAAALAAAMGASQAPAAESLAGAYLAARQADERGDVRSAADFYAAALERDRENAGLMELTLVNLLADGRLSQAAPIAEDLLESAPEHRVGNLAIVAEMLFQGRFGEAFERLRMRPDAFHPLIGRLLEAWAAEGLGDAGAVESALAALGDRPVFQLFAEYHRGLILAMRGEPAAAVAAFEAALEQIDSATTRFALAYGAALETAGRPDEARALYAGESGGALGEPALEAAIARLDAEEPAPLVAETAQQGAAEALFGVAGVFANESGRRYSLVYSRLATVLAPELVDAWLLSAQLLEQDGRHDLALAAYEAAPADTSYQVRIGTARARNLAALGRDDAAAEALRALVATRPDSIEAQVALGDHLRRSEAWEAAADAYEEALDLLEASGREAWSLHYQLGVAYERAGLWDLAEPQFRRALELEPEQPLVLNYLGYSLVEQRRNLDEAKAMIERAVELRPEDGYITDSLGWVLYRLDDFDGAVKWLEKAVELAPYDPVINDHLGDAYWMVGRRLEAEFQWRRARSLDPEPKDLERIKRKLDVGLDVVLSEEDAAAEAAAAATAAEANDG